MAAPDRHHRRLQARPLFRCRHALCGLLLGGRWRLLQHPSKQAGLPCRLCLELLVLFCPRMYDGSGILLEYCDKPSLFNAIGQ